MVGHVYAVASGKGGVGKTTTVINLGVVLRKQGKSVALVDADLGMPNLGIMLGIDHEPTLHDVLAKTAALDAAIVEEAPGFTIIPGSPQLTGFAEAEPFGLEEVLVRLAETHDYVLVDTSGGLTHEALLPLVVADEVLLVAQPSPAAIDDTRRTAELADIVGGRVAGAIVTATHDGSDAAAIGEALGTEVVGTIPMDPAVAECAEARKPLEAGAPDSPAAAAYRQLAMGLQDGAPQDASENITRSASSPPSDATDEPSTADTDSTATAESPAAADDIGNADDPVESAAVAAPPESVPADAPEESAPNASADEASNGETADAGAAGEADEGLDAAASDPVEPAPSTEKRSGRVTGWLSRLFG